MEVSMIASRTGIRGWLLASLGLVLVAGCDGRAVLGDPGEAGADDVAAVDDRGAAGDDGDAPDGGLAIDAPDAPDAPDVPDVGVPTADVPDDVVAEAGLDASVDVTDPDAPDVGPTVLCGNGRVDPGERCDTAIASGAGACLTACDDRNACTTDALANPGTCLAECASAPITAPRAGDGCCPPGATVTTDPDCAARCGDGTVSAGETCDTAIPSGAGACPVACNDGNVCTADRLNSPGTCTASCVAAPITAPMSGDGCCPAGATTATDADCAGRCGDGVVSSGEACDTAIAAGAGVCPRACVAPDACTTVALANAGTCAASCTRAAITTPVNGDRCCPAGASIATDNDCPVRCGDGVRSTPTETCDTAITSGAGACPVTCSDGVACTRDVLVGAACTVACNFAPITTPVGGDGCCPPGATIATDRDCPARCGDAVVTAPEQCDDGNTVANDGCGATCQREPRAYRMTAVTIQEPHFFFLVDITSNVNGEIATALTTDGATSADGNVDLSPIVYFRPGDQSSPSTPLTIDFASCTVPLTTTTCTRSAAPTLSTARNSLTGTAPCLAPLAGTFPAGRGINSPAPACFASDSVATLVIDLAGTPIRLRNAQVAARYNADPATVLQTGLISGFYPLAEANSTRLPTTIAIVGGRTIASLLRAADQDRLADGTVGWWFYLNFTASPVRYLP
jgi:cysteine-rich repeat protein